MANLAEQDTARIDAGGLRIDLQRSTMTKGAEPPEMKIMNVPATTTRFSHPRVRHQVRAGGVV